MTILIDGGTEELHKRKQLIRAPGKDHDTSNRFEMTRPEQFKDHIRTSVKIHTTYKNMKHTRKDFTFMMDSPASCGSALGNHYALFYATILGQGSDEQIQWWGQKAMNCEIIGSYCQTELGHGSNVRGLETTATYDKENQQFILNSPTLTSRKWLIGALGKASTHGVVFAQLIINGEEKGVHVFMVQIRDENHMPLPGLQIGDIGTKVGDHNNDNGIPREFMLCRHNQVQVDGTYTQKSENKQMHYFTMMGARSSMVSAAASRLSIASTIAIRYSSVRKQGFNNTAAGVSYNSSENQIINYKFQQYRLLKQLSLAYTMRMSAEWMNDKLREAEGQFGKITNVADIKEIAALSAALKSICTKIAVEGVEDLRKSCGGNGYLLNSGIAQMSCDYLWHITAEGDYIILSLLTAKYLLKGIQETMNGKQQKRLLQFFNVLLDPKYNLKHGAPMEAKTYQNYLDLQYLKEWFTYRALHKIINSAIILKKLVTKEKKTFTEAWNLASIDLIKGTWSYCYLLLFQNFQNRIEQQTNVPIKNALTKLCALFGCTNILDDDWNSILPPNQYQLVREAAYSLMEELRPDAVGLTDAFDYPDNVLNSTIGRFDGNVYEALVKASYNSSLNKTDPFDGYKEYLQPHLNKEFLKIGNNAIPDKFVDSKM